jgi:hypothetical protein
MRHLTAVALATAFLAATADAGSAATVPLAGLSAVPASVLGVAYIQGGNPSNGLSGPNQASWESVGFQRGAMDRIDAAAIRGDAALAEKWWPFIDVSFQHQRADGGFEYAPVIAGVVQQPINQFSGDSFWLGESEVALLLVRNSSFAPQFSARIDALVPKYRAALNYLTENKDSLMKTDFDARTGLGATNRIFADAEAFFLGEKLTGPNSAAHLAGEELLNRALAAQGPDGDFPEKGGHDTSYNAASCLRLAEMSAFVDDPRLMPALQRAESWEARQVHDDGRIETAENTRTNGQETYLGKPKLVNYSVVTRMFVFVHALTGDETSLDVAKKTAAYYHASSGK